MSKLQKKKSGFFLSTRIVGKSIKPKSKKQINKKENVRKEIANKLGPVRHAQQIQEIVHKFILETGSELEEKYFEPKHQMFNEIFKQKIEILTEKINYQLEKDSLFIRAEYDDKIAQVTKHHMDKFDEAISATEADLNNKYEEKLKQYKIDAEKTMFKSIEKSLTWRKNYLKQELGYFKEQNLADFKEYYRRLISSYRLRFKKKLDDMQKEHSLKYEKIKQSSVCKYKKMFDLEKTKLEKLLSEKVSLSDSDEENVDESEPHINTNVQKNFKC